VADKRRLPVLASAPEDPEIKRSPLQWSIFTAGLIISAWLSLAVIAQPVVKELVERFQARGGEAQGLALVAVQLVALGAASLAGGVVVGMWGPPNPRKVAGWGGAIAGLLAVVFAISAGDGGATAWLPVSLLGGGIVLPWATALAALGAWRGGKKRGARLGSG
jgi:hypothetical protein